MKLARKPGSLSEIWQVFISDSSSTTGAGLTGLTNASSGLTAYYHRDTDTTATAISLVSMTLGTFTSGGFKEIDATNMPGWYQFCPPNASITTGAKSCAIHLKGVTNMAPKPIEVDLDAQADIWGVNGTAVSVGSTVDANVVNFGGVAGTFSGGRPEVNTVKIAGTSQTAGDVVADAVAIKAQTDKLGFTAGGSVAADIEEVAGDNTYITELTQFLQDYANSLLSVSVSGVLGDVNGNVTGKVLGGGVGTITGAGVWALDGSGANLAVASTALSSAVWTNAKAAFITGDTFARLGAPAGASVSADIAAVPAAWGASVVGNGRTRDYFLQGGANKIVRTANSFTVYSTDDTTTLMTSVATADGSLNPLASVDPT